MQILGALLIHIMDPRTLDNSFTLPNMAHIEEIQFVKVTSWIPIRIKLGSKMSKF